MRKKRCRIKNKSESQNVDDVDYSSNFQGNEVFIISSSPPTIQNFNHSLNSEFRNENTQLKNENISRENSSQESNKKRIAKENRKLMEDQNEIVEKIHSDNITLDNKKWTLHNCEIVAYWESTNQFMWNLCQDEICYSQIALQVVPLWTGANSKIRKIKRIFDKYQDCNFEKWVLMNEKEFKEDLSSKVSNYYDKIINKIEQIKADKMQIVNNFNWKNWNEISQTANQIIIKRQNVEDLYNNLQEMKKKMEYMEILNKWSQIDINIDDFNNMESKIKDFKETLVYKMTNKLYSDLECTKKSNSYLSQADKLLWIDWITDKNQEEKSDSIYLINSTKKWIFRIYTQKDKFERYCVDISEQDKKITLRIRQLTPSIPEFSNLSSILQPYDTRTGLWNYSNECEFLQGVLLDDSRYFILLTMVDKVTRIYEWLFNNNELPNLEHALKPHIKWGLTSFRNNYIIWIGSIIISKEEYSWEIYNISQNWWKYLPNLANSRIGHWVIVINDYLYWFGGKSLTYKADYWRSFERLNLSKVIESDNCKNERWTTILPSMNIKFYWSWVAKIDDNEVLIFGGINANYDPKKKSNSIYSPGVKKTYIFNATQYELKIGDSNLDLHQRDLFWESQAVNLNSKLYSFGNIQNDLHIFDLDKKSWTVWNKTTYSKLNNQN